MNRRWLIPVGIIVALILIVVLPLVGSYNDLVQREETVNNSFADLDTQLQRRTDLIPNLSNAVKAALGQERAVFGQIAEARTRYARAETPEQKVEAGNAMESAFGRLLAIFEQYPRLESNQRIADLMTQLEGTENRVAQARREYNAAATGYNVNIRRFPRSLIAGMFGFDRKPLFETAPEDRDAPEVDLELEEDDAPAPTG